MLPAPPAADQAIRASPLTYGDPVPHQQSAPPDPPGTPVEDPPGGLGPVVTSARVDFRVPHWSGVDGVRLELDWSLGPVDPELRRHGDRWLLRVPRPAVDRFEYQFTVRSAAGTDWITDPGNPAVVPNPFGDKSEIRFPEYVEPQWLSEPATGSTNFLPTDAGRLDCPVPVTVWTPDWLDPAQETPLLLAHDGSDMAHRGSLLRWATRAAARNTFRVALLDPAPGLRDRWYAADEDYADHLATVLLPAIARTVPVGRTVGLGASLGALSMLAVQRRHPWSLDALVLQSGSFFTHRLDPQETGYGFFDRICSAVADLAVGPAENQGQVLITCGAVEENRANNEQMATVLTGQGYQVAVHIVPDAHTMVGWRDSWSPGLENLLHRERPPQH